MVLFVWFDSLSPINNISVIKGWVLLGWTSTKLGLIFLLKDTRQWRWCGSNPRSLGLESSTLPLSHCTPRKDTLMYSKCSKMFKVCPKGIHKQHRPRSDCFFTKVWSGSIVFAVLTSILWIPALINNILFGNKKEKSVPNIRTFTVNNIRFKYKLQQDATHHVYYILHSKGIQK